MLPDDPFFGSSPIDQTHVKTAVQQALSPTPGIVKTGMAQLWNAFARREYRLGCRDREMAQEPAGLSGHGLRPAII